MNPQPNKPSPGRPKTFNRAAVTDAAMQAYWNEGVSRISINEICRRASVSKPGIYREFGNEDGLTKAAITLYFEQTLAPMIAMIVSELPFREKLNTLVDILSADSSTSTKPTTCLLADMRDCADTLGEATQAQLKRHREQVLQAYEKMITMAKSSKEISNDISTPLAAQYIDSQITNAVLQQRRAENPTVIRNVLILAFSVFS